MLTSSFLSCQFVLISQMQHPLSTLCILATAMFFCFFFGAKRWSHLGCRVECCQRTCDNVPHRSVSKKCLAAVQLWRGKLLAEKQILYQVVNMLFYALQVDVLTRMSMRMIHWTLWTSFSSSSLQGPPQRVISPCPQHPSCLHVLLTAAMTLLCDLPLTVTAPPFKVPTANRLEFIISSLLLEYQELFAFAH